MRHGHFGPSVEAPPLVAAVGGGGGPAPTGATGLPPGWQELSANGQVYYWNTETNVTQYERPQ